MKFCKIGLIAIVATAAVTAAPKAVKPKNFSMLFAKNWTLQKATYKGKDMTARANEGMTGGVWVYTFSADGAMTTTEPSTISADWNFNEKGLNVHTTQAPNAETPAGAPGPQATVTYLIKKLTKDTLVLEQPGMKMTLTFKAK
jgi:hypothetical protein